MADIIQRTPPMAVDITPAWTVGHSTARTSGNVIHPIIGRDAPNVTLHPAGLRSGTLTLLFDDAESATYCEAMHAEGGVFTLYRTGLPWATMAYVTNGRIGMEINQTRYSVTVDFQEVHP